jgi:serine/threonine protein kinase
MPEKSTGFCPNCFYAPYVGGRCSQCGYRATEQGERSVVLSAGTVLERRFLLGRLLGVGGFGVTYLAMDIETQTKLAIKEYFPSSLTVRKADGRIAYNGTGDRRIFEHGLHSFNREAESLKTFVGDPNIVQVAYSFNENDTSYFVMEYLNGANMRVLIGGMGGKLPYPFALEILSSMAEALKRIHAQGLLHRDISPENIFITKEGKIKLIDFGATRYYVGEHSRSLAVVLKPGFAPPEQYSAKGNQGPWTDVYALAATFYYSVTGVKIPDAPDRLAGARIKPMQSLSANVGEGLSEAVDKALALDYRDRWQDMDSFRRAISNVGEKRVEKKSVVVSGTPFIRMETGALAGEKWPIPSNVDIRIGRSSGVNNVVIYDNAVSREHCVIRFDNKQGVFLLRDLSSNGTFCNDGSRCRKGESQALAPGSLFFLTNPDHMVTVGLE